jgi:hypothetical protein
VNIAMRVIVIGATAVLIGGLAPSVRAQAPIRSAFVAYRVVDAEVSKVEGRTLLLKTDAGRLKLDVSGQAMPDLKKAAKVALGVTLIRHPDPAALPRDHGSRSRTVQRLQALITSIQRDNSIVSLNCAAGRLNVSLPEAAIAVLHTGDRLAVELSLPSDSDVAALAGQKQNHDDRVGLAAWLFAIFGRGR